MRFWRVMCQTKHHPGQWQSWFKEQCCAVGWPPSEWNGRSSSGWSFNTDDSVKDKAWNVARNALREMSPGDRVAVLLPGGRVGRVGEIVRLEVDDDQWNPIVQPSVKYPFGENGRRIIVRWDLSAGPADPGIVARLPKGLRDNGQAAISRIMPGRFEKIESVLRDATCWEPVYGNFAFERALSDYIALHPYRLEDGMTVHPSAPKVREWTIQPGYRVDVILQDKSRRTTLVECKQAGVNEQHIDQLASYMRILRSCYPEWGEPRGVLIHGGSRNVELGLRRSASSKSIELVHHELRVDFAR